MSLTDDAIVIVRGRFDARDEDPKLKANEIIAVQVTEDRNRPVRVRVPAANDTTLAALKDLLLEHPGESPVFLHLAEDQVVALPDGFRIDANRGIVGHLRVLLGADAIL